MYLCDVDTTCFRAELKIMVQVVQGFFVVLGHFVVFLEVKLNLNEVHLTKCHLGQTCTCHDAKSASMSLSDAKGKTSPQVQTNEAPFVICGFFVYPAALNI